MKYTTEYIEINTGLGKEKRPIVRQRNGLAVLFKEYTKESVAYDWSLTHITSGWAVMRYRTKEEALRALDSAVCAGLNWTCDMEIITQRGGRYHLFFEQVLKKI